MKLYLSSANVKIFNEKDVVSLCKPKCSENEAFSFQVYVENAKAGEYSVRTNSDLCIDAYEVVRKKGNYEKNKKTDEFYLRSEDDTYPELLLPVQKLCFAEGESKTLFFNVSEQLKKAGTHTIEVCLGETCVTFALTVVAARLADNDLIVTHWFHSDAVCNYYRVEPFSEEYYVRFKHFLAAYVRLGNTMLLVPMFTPPLDTEIGKERLTTQLTKVIKRGEEYEFDFSEAKRYIDIAKSYGIKYFELSHLFTQWGGEACPKIMAEENGEKKNIFGWNVSSSDERYLKFLQAYFKALNEFLIAEGIKENTYMHLTDEPSEKHVEKYVELASFVKANNYGIKTTDALSHYELAEKTDLDLPVVCTQSVDLPLFSGRKKLLYYCVWIDENCLSNRYFHMPSLRTVILGAQLYLENVQGFLHWGYNFYNTALSKRAIDPYEDATAGGDFVAGDPFIVYPAKEGVNYSHRYFSMMKAFEDYRLLKAVERVVGRAETEKILTKYGIADLHTYPHELEKYEAMRAVCYDVLESKAL